MNKFHQANSKNYTKILEKFLQEVYNVREIHHFTVMNYKDHVEWKTNYEAGGNRLIGEIWDSHIM